MLFGFCIDDMVFWMGFGRRVLFWWGVSSFDCECGSVFRFMIVVLFGFLGGCFEDFGLYGWFSGFRICGLRGVSTELTLCSVFGCWVCCGGGFWISSSWWDGSRDLHVGYL